VLANVIFSAAVLALTTSQALAGHTDRSKDWGKPNSVMLFGGVATSTNFTTSIFVPWENDFHNIGFVGLAGSKRLGTLTDLADFVSLDLGSITDDFSIEGEGGTGVRFGAETSPEAWAGLFLRYHDFPWNDRLYTTIAVNTGVSYLFKESEFERNRDDNEKSTNLLHYMGPELTFSNPENKDREWVLRFHHRSGVFGLFDGVVSGSTFITIGYRQRF
jgi:hypothetical protein